MKKYRWIDDDVKIGFPIDDIVLKNVSNSIYLETIDIFDGPKQ